MVILSKKLGQFKQVNSKNFILNFNSFSWFQWTGEKFGNSQKTQKSTEFKQLQLDIENRFQLFQSLKDSLKRYMKELGINYYFF